ncbi:MAG: NusG domain II-containing protein [Gammaproteobacteria bacterium]
MTRSDMTVIFLMLIVLSVLYSKYWSFGNNENTEHYAQVSITNAPQQKIRLTENKIYTIAGRIGDTRIQVKDHQIRFLNSPCHKKYCIHSGWLSNTGSIAACIPNGITVSIKNLKSTFDAINF